MPFDKPYMISYLSSIVIMSLSCTVSQIYGLFPKNLKTLRDCDYTPTQGTVCNPSAKTLQWRTSVQNLKSLALSVLEIGDQEFKRVT